MATHVLSKSGATPETLVGVADQLAAKAMRDSAAAQVLADCVSVAMRMAIDIERDEVDFRGLSVNGGTFGRLPLDEIRIKRLSLANSVVHELALGSIDGAEGIRFHDCLISKVCGVIARAGLPAGLVDDATEIEAFDSLATNNAVLKSDLPPSLKALVTVLRKLYRQPGSGRKIGAFSRGITKPEVARFVEPVLGLLQHYRFVTVFNSVVHPIRKQSPRVDKILLAPNLSDDELVKAVRALV